MLCENCEKILIKSIQRKYYKTVMNIQMGDEVVIQEKQIPVKIKENNNNKEKEKEKKLMIFD